MAQKPRGRMDDLADLLSGRIFNTLRLLLKRTAEIGPLKERLRKVMSQQKRLEEQLDENLGRISRAIGSVAERLRAQEGRLSQMQGRIDAGADFSSADLADEVAQTAALAEQLETLARVADPADPTTISPDGVLATGQTAPAVAEALTGAGGRDNLTGMPTPAQAAEAARDATLADAERPGQAADAGEPAPGEAGSALGAAGGDAEADEAGGGQ